ncbi:MAG: hypothetical protein J6A29_03140 [Clostridia bacterium]|nr:hypothetical protein [Clostridia bacterium]
MKFSAITKRSPPISPFTVTVLPIAKTLPSTIPSITIFSSHKYKSFSVHSALEAESSTRVSSVITEVLSVAKQTDEIKIAIIKMQDKILNLFFDILILLKN